MADAKKCDRCGKLYEYNSGAPSLGARAVCTMAFYDRFMYRAGGAYDLCPYCANEVIRWLDKYGLLESPCSYGLPIEEEDKKDEHARQNVTGNDESQDSSREDSEES